MKQIYLIEKLWISEIAHKDHEAYGYEIIGYLEKEEEIPYYINSSTRIYDVNDCWAIKDRLPEYRVYILNKLEVNEE